MGLKIKDVYLVLYNLASAVGWAYVLFLAFTALKEKRDAESLWADIEMPLTVCFVTKEYGVDYYHVGDCVTLSHKSKNIDSATTNQFDVLKIVFYL
jgi:hypothetical protein